MLANCDDVLLEDMKKEEELELHIDESFHEAVDTLFGFDGEDPLSMTADNGLLFPQPMKRYEIKGDVGIL